MILDGKMVSQRIKEEVAKEALELTKKGVKPGLAVILAGNDPASRVYVNNKKKACEACNIHSEEYTFGENVTEEELLELIDALNSSPSIHGILVQSPVPKHIDANKAFGTISPEKDVDGFHPINVGNLCIGKDAFISCTPYGIVKILEEYNIETEGKEAVILGRSNIVGKPMIQCMLNKNATVTVCHSKTKNIEEITKRADILIAAIGKEKFVKENMVKDGAVIIDVGINRLEDGSIVGDVDFENVSKKSWDALPNPEFTGRDILHRKEF